MHELPGHRLRTGHVGVRLHPHPAGRHEPPLRHRLAHPRPHLGPVLLHPGPLLRLGHGEHELRPVLDQGGHVGRRPGHLADRLAQRPQPRRVDVRVPDGADPVGGGHGGRGQDTGQLFAGAGRGAVHVLEVDGVQGAFDGAQDVVPARGVDRQLGHQFAEHLQIEDQLPHGLVEDGEVHAAERVLRSAPGGLLLAEGGGSGPEDQRIGGGLDVQAHPLAARDGGPDPHPLVARVQALHRGAVGPVDQALALESGQVLLEAQVEQGLDGPARPRLGHGAGHPEPAGAPGGAPPGAHLDRPVLGREPLCDRHGLAGRVPHRDLERHGLGVHGRSDALAQDTAQAVLHQSAVVMHTGCSLPGSGCSRVGLAADSLRNAFPSDGHRTLDVPCSTGHSSPCAPVRTGE